jgi:hypothetical protein
MCSDAPDTSGMNAAAQANAEIAKEALDFYKGIYASDIRPAQEKQQRLADQLVGDYLDTSKRQRDFANEQNAYYKETFQPVERKMVSDAMEYDSDANINRVSGEAPVATASPPPPSRAPLAPPSAPGPWLLPARPLAPPP